MAFGGVATGNMKANDAEITPGNIRYRGCRPISKANDARMGSSSAEVAVFEVNSVSPATNKDTITTTNQSGSDDTDTSWMPINLLRPETYRVGGMGVGRDLMRTHCEYPFCVRQYRRPGCSSLTLHTSAKANPPPISNTTPHGKFLFTFFQSKSAAKRVSVIKPRW